MNVEKRWLEKESGGVSEKEGLKKKRGNGERKGEKNTEQFRNG